jgi:hypothetical protein
MFSEKVKELFTQTLPKDTFQLKKINEWNSIFTSTDLDILITYDEREHEIYVNLDLSKYFKLKNYLNELQFPLYLNVDIVYNHLKGFRNESTVSTLAEGLKIKYSQFTLAWNELIRNPDYKEILADLLKEERKKLKAQIQLEQIQKLLDLAHISFKAKDYKKTIDLLNPIKDNLGKYDKEILNYSLKKEHL